MTCKHLMAALPPVSVLLIGLSGCGSNVVVTEVLNHHTCKLRGPGVRQIDHAELPDVRGARMLVEPGTEQPDLAGDKPRVLVAVSRGAQPTAAATCPRARSTIAFAARPSA